jgi:outer membrane protein assembly factor BamB
MSGTGFMNVVTQPAGAHSTSVPGLGTFAAGPTIGSDGTVYLGSLEGKVIALHADGTSYWNRELPPASSEHIVTPIALDADQSAYVVGVHSDVAVADHRAAAGSSRVVTYRATLYKFTAGGGAPVGNSTPIPDLRPGAAPGEFGPSFVGEPAIWQFDADRAVIVPVGYPTLSGAELHMLAFSPEGGVMADVTVGRWSSGDATGEGDLWEYFAGFEPAPISLTPTVLTTPIPGPSIFTNPLGGTPFITIADPLQRDIVSYTFCVGAACSPAPGFTERVRIGSGGRTLLSGAVTLSDQHSVVGTDDGIVFGGPSAASADALTGLGRIAVTPTQGFGYRLVLLNNDGVVAVMKDHTIVSRISISGFPAARAAASRTNVFVATDDGLHTLDALAQTEVLNFPWNGVWVLPPAIGPDGRVYAMTSNTLFIFPPPPGRRVFDPRPI